ncbi:divergent polysaccharide deacetylase family protein, partial [Plastoroseomonas hellenica]|uniref:divergent polysaccharide deacetylase family protein n=1 Tax=Plastoroseomonas hellenica TaxID=2687306 RepID=UPI001BA4F23E
APPPPQAEAPVPEPQAPRAEAPAPQAPAPDQPAAAGPTVVPAAADPALIEPGRYGPLPRIGLDGRTPIRAYGRAFDRGNTRPRIAVVIGDVGMNAAQADEALRRLPPEIALALSPYGHRLPQLAARIRERGTEILAAIPLEPAGYPLNDPGDRALLTAQPLSENLDRLGWALSRFPAYVGAIGAIGGMRGERFAQVPELIGAVQDALRARGLLYLDPRPGSGNPARAWGRGVDLVIDEPATRGEIERRLAELERIARERGSALGLAGSPTPVLVERLANWAAGLDASGLALVPPTALIRRPEGLADATSTPPPRTP